LFWVVASEVTWLTITSVNLIERAYMGLALPIVYGRRLIVAVGITEPCAAARLTNGLDVSL
jgi:hypothetical protein